MLPRWLQQSLAADRSKLDDLVEFFTIRGHQVSIPK
jgi:hypothetical protein